MSPKPFTENSQREYSTNRDDLEWCVDCQRFYWRDHGGHQCNPKPVTSWWEANTVICTAVIIVCAILAGWLLSGTAHARPGAIHPVPAPQSLLHARAACPNTASIPECRAALRRAYAAVAWQKQARWRKAAGKSTDVVRDAITWASNQTGVAAWRMIRIGTCESHLFWLAQTGQYKGWAQLGVTHRSDPIFRVVPWQDPYAQAIHMARFIRAHGEGQWQCTSSGGLRW